MGFTFSVSRVCVCALFKAALTMSCIAPGKLGTGKDHIAKHLFQPMFGQIPALFLSLADPFKLRVIVERGIPREQIYGEKTEQSRKELQLEGTERGRKVFGEDVWIQYVHQTILNHLDRGIRLFLITDV